MQKRNVNVWFIIKKIRSLETYKRYELTQTTKLKNNQGHYRTINLLDSYNYAKQNSGIDQLFTKEIDKWVNPFSCIIMCGIFSG